MKNRIVFVSRAASRKNGGSSSMLDLAQASISLRFDTKILTPLGKLDLLLYRPSGGWSVFNSLGTLPLNSVDSDYAALPSRVEKLSKLIGINAQLNNKTFNSIVIDDVGLHEKTLDKLRKNNSYVILNHAGSPNGYINYFGNAPLVQEQNRISRYKNYIGRYDRILLQSIDQAKILENICPKVKYSVLNPSCNETDIADALRNTNFEVGGTVQLAVVGSIQPRKNQMILLRLAQILLELEINFKIHVIGPTVDPNYAQKFRIGIQKNGLSRHILLHGHRNDYLKMMANCDLILQPSLEEGVSRVLREALALSKPIVAFSISGTTSLLTHGVNSHLANINDIRGLVNGIAKIATSPKIYKEMSLQAAQTYQEQCSLKKYISHFKDIIDRINMDRMRHRNGDRNNNSLKT